MEAALWYLRHHVLEVDFHDSEEDAAHSAIYMLDYDHGVPIGVQLKDGTMHPWENWPLRDEIEKQQDEEYDRRWREAAKAPKPKEVTVRCPFTADHSRYATTQIIEANCPLWFLP